MAVSAFAKRILTEVCTDFSDVLFDVRNITGDIVADAPANSSLDVFKGGRLFTKSAGVDMSDVKMMSAHAQVWRAASDDASTAKDLLLDKPGSAEADVVSICSNLSSRTKSLSILAQPSYCTTAAVHERHQLLMLYALHCLLVTSSSSSFSSPSSPGGRELKADRALLADKTYTQVTTGLPTLASAGLQDELPARVFEVAFLLTADTARTSEMAGVMDSVPDMCDVDVWSLAELASRALVGSSSTASKSAHSPVTAPRVSDDGQSSEIDALRTRSTDCALTTTTEPAATTSDTVCDADVLRVAATTCMISADHLNNEARSDDKGCTPSCQVCLAECGASPCFSLRRPTVLIGTFEEWCKVDLDALLQPRREPGGRPVAIHVAAVCVEDAAAIASHGRTFEWERLMHTINLHSAREHAAYAPALHRFPHIMCGCNAALATLPRRLRDQLSRQRRRYYPVPYDFIMAAMTAKTRRVPTSAPRTTAPPHTRMVYLASVDEDDHAEQLRVILTSFVACGRRVVVLTHASQVRRLFHRIRHWNIGLAAKEAHDAGVTAVYNEPDSTDDDDGDVEVMSYRQGERGGAHDEVMSDTSSGASRAEVCGRVGLGYLESGDDLEHILRTQQLLLDRQCRCGNAACTSLPAVLPKQDTSDTRAETEAASRHCATPCASLCDAAVLVAWEGYVGLDAMDVDVIVQYHPPTRELDEGALAAYVRVLHSTVDVERDIACTLNGDAAESPASLRAKPRWLHRGLTSEEEADGAQHMDADDVRMSAASATQAQPPHGAASPPLTIITMFTPSELPAVARFVAAYYHDDKKPTGADTPAELTSYSLLTRSSSSKATASCSEYAALACRHDAAAQPVWNMSPRHPMFSRLICGLDIASEALRQAILAGVPDAATRSVPAPRLCTFEEIDQDVNRVLRAKVAKQNRLIADTRSMATEEEAQPRAEPQRAVVGAKAKKESAKNRRKESAKNKRGDKAEVNELPPPRSSPPPPPPYHSSVQGSGAILVPPFSSSGGGGVVSVTRGENDKGSLLLQKLSLLTSRAKADTVTDSERGGSGGGSGGGGGGGRADRCNDSGDGGTGGAGDAKDKASYASNGASQRVNVATIVQLDEGAAARTASRHEAAAAPRPKGQSSAAAVISKLLSAKDRSAVRGLRGGRGEASEASSALSEVNAARAERARTTASTATASSTAGVLISVKDLPTSEPTRTTNGSTASNNDVNEERSNGGTLPERRRAGRGRGRGRREGKGGSGAPSEDVTQPPAAHFVDVLAKMGIKTRVEGPGMPI